jgi:hypothetical protein
MARNIAQRLDRLERLAHELLNANQGPVYARGEVENVASERLVIIKRVFIDPPEREESELPKVALVSSPPIERFQRKFAWVINVGWVTMSPTRQQLTARILTFLV